MARPPFVAYRTASRPHVLHLLPGVTGYYRSRQERAELPLHPCKHCPYCVNLHATGGHRTGETSHPAPPGSPQLASVGTTGQRPPPYASVAPSSPRRNATGR